MGRKLCDAGAALRGGCFRPHPKAPGIPGASVMLSTVTRYWLVTGLNLYVKELGSSRSPVRRLGDHFADPGLSGGFTSRVVGRCFVRLEIKVTTYSYNVQVVWS